MEAQDVTAVTVALTPRDIDHAATPVTTHTTTHAGTVITGRLGLGFIITPIR